VARNVNETAKRTPKTVLLNSASIYIHGSFTERLHAKSCYSLGFSTIFSLMYVLASLKYRDFVFYVVHLMENYSKSIAFYIFGERWGKGCSCSNFSVCVQSENNTSRRRLKTPESTSSDFLRFLPSSVQFSSFSAIEL